MKITEMFANNINRKINGVIKVNQIKEDAIEQELNEYIITEELKKHFLNFFNCYAESFQVPKNDIGVWISGFFGSGKSHFLKILSYLLSNKEIYGISTLERFRKKFADDFSFFTDIEKSVKNPAETILFNIDVVGPVNKNATAVMRVFAKMFYNHIGFYGDNLNVVQLEKHLVKQKKFDEFKEEFEKINGASWIESRESYSFFEDAIVETMKKVLGISETAARNWFAISDITELDSNMEISIENLVADMKKYVDSKPDDFRLIFMIDEVGQYIGTDTGMLLNLQSIVEEIGSKCSGKVWVICTGQEDIDELIKRKSDEFSRIQARFKTRLFLSSSSADEVIKKRVLKKTPEAQLILENIYKTQNYVMSNIFNFKNAVKNIEGFKSIEEFTGSYPFIPYQFILMQKVFLEIRNYGNAGKHLSGGERSMLSVFQEAAQKVQNRDEKAVVPFYIFYDAVHTFLDSAIRDVVERCEKEATEEKGIEDYDVNILKLLYLIRYLDEVPANIENIVVFMVDNIYTDKIESTKKIENSLNRLIENNYIIRIGDTYKFLTAFEQNIEKEIKEEYITSGEVIKKISEIIFDGIYTRKKISYNSIYEFEFNKQVDTLSVGRIKDRMSLRFLTAATDELDKNTIRLMSESKDSVIAVLPSDHSSYYKYIENSIKISKYLRKKSMSQISEAVRNILGKKEKDVEKYENDAFNKIKVAITKADFYVAGEKIKISGASPEAKINKALEYLISAEYHFLNLIDKNITSKHEILEYSGENLQKISEINRCAADEMERYLQIQKRQNILTDIEDIKNRYKNSPYGWREIDIISVVVKLIFEKRVQLKYCGETVVSDDHKIVELLCEQDKIQNLTLSIRERASAKNIKKIREFLKEYFDLMDVPENENEITDFAIGKFKNLKSCYKELLGRYNGYNYPDRDTVQRALLTVSEILDCCGDSMTLISKILEMEEELEDMKEDLEDVQEFFSTQIDIFDEAVALESMLRYDADYFTDESAIKSAMVKIKEVVVESPKKKGRFNYREIPVLNSLINTVKNEYARLLEMKRKELAEVIDNCHDELEKFEKINSVVDNRVLDMLKFLEFKREELDKIPTITILDSFCQRILCRKNETVRFIEKELTKETPENKQNKLNEILKIGKDIIFEKKLIKNEEDVDSYLKEVRKKLELMLKYNKEIDIV